MASSKFYAISALAIILASAAPVWAANPDLTVSNITVVRGAKDGACNAVRVDVRNSQNVGVTGSFRVNLGACYWVPEIGYQPYEKVVNGIGPGMTTPVWFHQVALNLPGQACNEIKATVDQGNQIAETTDGNNTRTEPITIGEACKTLSIADATAYEPGSGQATRNMTITLSEPHNQSVAIDYQTAASSYSARQENNAGPAGATYYCGYRAGDYVSKRGRVTLSAGQTSVTVPVSICADSTLEPLEMFDVRLGTVYGGVAVSDGLGHVFIKAPRTLRTTTTIRTRGEDGEDVEVDEEVIEEIPPED